MNMDGRGERKAEVATMACIRFQIETTMHRSSDVYLKT